jgi:RNA polymerase sigma-70 factor, ECF subfamily
VIFRKNTESLTDQELLIRYLEKSHQQSLAALFLRYSHMVFGVCLKYLTHADDAAEAAVKIFEKLCADIHRHEIIHFPNWLYVITRNHCLLELRYRKTTGEIHETGEHLVYMESEPYTHPLDDETFLNRDRLSYCLKNLNLEQRKCIEMFYFHNKCFMEISQELYKDETRVKSCIEHGKRNLKTCLEQKHEKESAYNDTPSAV